MPVVFFAETDFESLFTWASLYVIVALVVIEGLLSVDNALAIAAMASHLEEKKRKTAMNIGYAGAYGFRILALLLTSFILHQAWLMALGAAYLIWLMCNHFADSEDQEEHEGKKERVPPSFGKTIAMIALLDLSLSFDNVVAAVAFAKDNIYLVYLGVTIGILTLRLVAGYCIKLLDKHPWLEHTAFLLVGFVGVLLCVELYWDYGKFGPYEVLNYPVIYEDDSHFHIQKAIKFGGIFMIILGHLAYEKVNVIRTLFRPIVICFRHFFALFARTINLIFSVVTWPIRALISAFRNKAAGGRK